jgi:hypothetical protein
MTTIKVQYQTYHQLHILCTAEKTKVSDDKIGDLIFSSANISQSILI